MTRADDPLWPPTDRDAWGQNGTEGGAHGSFAKRYARPLALVARRVLALDEEGAADLAYDFLATQVVRDGREVQPVFAQWRPEVGPFRNYLFRAFLNHCADLQRRRRRSEAAHRSLEEVDEPAVAGQVERWILREQIEVARRLVLAASPERFGMRPRVARDVLRYLALRWPADLTEPPPTHAEVAARLELPVNPARYVSERASALVVEVLRSHLHEEGLEPDREELVRAVARLLVA